MPKVTIVNNQDEVIGAAEKSEAFAKGLIRRTARILIVDQDGRVFLQKRGPNKFPFPNRWTESAGGHVDEGESYEQVAHRELEEEIGLKDLRIEKIDYFYDKIEMLDGVLSKNFVQLIKLYITEANLS